MIANIATPAGVDPRLHVARIGVFHVKCGADSRDRMRALVSGEVSHDLWRSSYALVATIIPDVPIKLERACSYAWGVTNTVEDSWHGMDNVPAVNGGIYKTPVPGVFVHAPLVSSVDDPNLRRNMLCDHYRSSMVGDVFVLHFQGGRRFARAVSMAGWTDLGWVGETWPERMADTYFSAELNDLDARVRQEG